MEVGNWLGLTAHSSVGWENTAEVCCLVRVFSQQHPMDEGGGEENVRAGVVGGA